MAHFMRLVLERFPDYGTAPCIRPFQGNADINSYDWGLVTFREFLEALLVATSYWKETLSQQSMKSGDVVGLWLLGSSWTDLVHIYAICAAGFVPELFGQAFTPRFIQDLLDAHDAKVLIADAAFQPLLSQASLRQAVVGLPVQQVQGSHTPTAVTAASDLPNVAEDDVAIIFHTSGTSGGRPKPVPQTHKWLLAGGAVALKVLSQQTIPGQLVYNNLGSFASIGAATCVVFMSVCGACLTQSSGREIAADEFLLMVERGKLNVLVQYAPWLARTISAARSRPDVLAALRRMRQISYTGASLAQADEKWALDNQIPLTVVYANTESGSLMVSPLGSGEMYLRPVEGIKCKLIPVQMQGENPEVDSTSRRLLDFFISADSPTCPHSSIRNRADGHVTGDLFEEVKPGSYAFRGRSDDWIRTGGNPAFCDTKAIEDNVRKTCADLVHNCVVVGHQRICPILIVEPADNTSPLAKPGGDVQAALKREILSRTADFNQSLFPHEQIVRPECIMVVPVGSLPRTSEKGNVRRKATEELFMADIEAIYASL